MAFADSGQVQSACAVSMIASALQSPALRGVINRTSPRVPAARNYLVREFLASGMDWLWFVDTDMQFPPDALDRLLAAADPEHRPVVGGLCFALAGREPCSTIMQKNPDGVTYSIAIGWRPNQLVEVDATGAACLLIHRGLLERMREKFPAPNHWFADEIHDGIDMGHDLVFCERVKALGFPVHVHTGVAIGHLKMENHDVESYVRWVTRNRFLVTGTGACGLRYVATLLSSLGIPIGCQQVYNLPAILSGDIQWRVARGDASWLAAPFLPHFVGDVVHVVRHPLRVIDAIVDCGFFRRVRGQPGHDETAWVHRMSGRDPNRDETPPDAGGEAALAAAHYLSWNRMIERHARLRLRVEDVDLAAVQALLDALGATRDAARIQSVLSMVGRDGSTTDAADRIDWADLPPELELELREMAARYGYHP